MKDKVEQLRQELKEFSEKMELKIAAIEKPSRWYSPEECNWYFNAIGQIQSTEYTIINCEELARLFQGFLTEEDAEYYREIPRLLRPLAKALRELNEGWWPDFNTDDPLALWVAGFNTIKWCAVVWGQTQEHHSALYAKSRDIMEQALEIAQLNAPI